MSASSTQNGTQVRLPKLGESVTEGTIGSWLKKVGDQVDKYDPLVEITTDKVNAEVPSPIAGTLVKIVAEEGETLPVGAEICIIDEGGSAAAPAPAPAEQPVQAPSAAPSGNGQGATAARSPRPTSPEGEMELLRTRSSPAVRRIAEEHGVDISQVRGSGIGGRVTKSDIQSYIEQQKAAPPPAAPTPVAEQRAVGAAGAAIQETISPPKPEERVAAPAAAPAAPSIPSAPPAPLEAPRERPSIPIYEGDQVVPLTPMRRQVAEHMVRSERTAPHVTAWMEVDMSNVVAARTQAKERFAREEGFELTYLPFVIKAVVAALREHPEVNAVWDENQIIRRRAINIGVAIGMEDGLVVPVIHHADEKSIAGIARALRDLSNRARANRLTIEDVEGGTFTVNNPGTFGTVLSTPIIVQPQAAILSTEAIIKRPIVVDDAITIRPMMNLSLSIDHRVLDGLVAARFLATIKRTLEAFRPDTSLY